MSKLQRFLAPIFWINRRVRQLTVYQRFRNFREEMENQKLNRELIGVDREGNKYYQYFSYFGLPTRREIDFKEKNNIIMKDLAFYDWLCSRQPNAPTPQDLLLFYEAEAQRLMLAKKWDDEQAQLMNDFRERQFELMARQKARLQAQEQQILESDHNEVMTEIKSRVSIPEQPMMQKEYQPELWKPEPKKYHNSS